MAGPFIWGPEGTAQRIGSGPTVGGSTALDGNGEKNYLLNPSATLDTSNWAISGAGTLARDTSASLPRRNTTTTGFAFTSTTNGEYVRTRFTLDAADLSSELKVSLSAAVSASSAFRVEVYKNSASDYSGSYTEFALSTDSSGNSYLANATDVFQALFTTDSTAYIELRIVHNGGSSHTMYFSDVVVGPGMSLGYGVATPSSQGLVSTAAQSLGGVKTFNDGIILDDAADQSTLNYFRAETHATTLSYNGSSGGTSGTTNWRICRLDRTVHLTLMSQFNATSGTGSSLLTANTILPTWARPVNLHVFTPHHAVAGGGVQSQLITMLIETSGAFYYQIQIGGVNFTNSTAYTFYCTTFTFAVA